VKFFTSLSKNKPRQLVEAFAASSFIVDVEAETSSHADLLDKFSENRDIRYDEVWGVTLDTPR
jgi:hypothetical protein